MKQHETKIQFDKTLLNLTKSEVGGRIENAVKSVDYLYDVDEVVHHVDTVPRRIGAIVGFDGLKLRGDTLNVVITNDDILTVSHTCLSLGLSPAIHVPIRVDGKYDSSNNQATSETETTKRSSLFVSLRDPFHIDEQRNWEYPSSHKSLVYSPEIFFFQKSDGTISPIREQLWISVFSSGVDNSLIDPPFKPKIEYFKNWEDCEFRCRNNNPLLVLYEGLFSAAPQKNHDSLVLYRLAGMDISNRFCDSFPKKGYHVFDAFAKSLAMCDLKCVVVCFPQWNNAELEVLKNFINNYMYY